MCAQPITGVKHKVSRKTESRNTANILPFHFLLCTFFLFTLYFYFFFYFLTLSYSLFSSCQAWAILPSLTDIETTDPSSAPTTAPRLLSTATKTPPDVCFRSSLLALSSVILDASAAKFHPSLASLLNCYSISSFLSLCSIQKKKSHFPLYLLKNFFSVLHANPLSKVHQYDSASFFISVQSSPFGSLHRCGFSSVHLPSFTSTSCCILTTTSFLLCGPSAAALTHSQFCSKKQKEKEPPPKLPQDLSRFWNILLSSWIPFLSHLLFSSSQRGLRSSLCTFSTNSFCTSPSSSLSFSSFSSTSLPFAFSERATFRLCGFCHSRFSGPSPGCFFQEYVGSYSGCFLQRFSGPSPGCFFLGFWGPSPGCSLFFFLPDTTSLSHPPSASHFRPVI